MGRIVLYGKNFIDGGVLDIKIKEEIVYRLDLEEKIM